MLALPARFFASQSVQGNLIGSKVALGPAVFGIKNGLKHRTLQPTLCMDLTNIALQRLPDFKEATIAIRHGKIPVEREKALSQNKNENVVF